MERGEIEDISGNSRWKDFESTVKMLDYNLSLLSQHHNNKYYVESMLLYSRHVSQFQFQASEGNLEPALEFFSSQKIHLSGIVQELSYEGESEWSREITPK